MEEEKEDNEEMDLSSLFNASCTTHEKLEADDADADVNELTPLLKDSNTHNRVEAWQELIDAIEYCEDLLYFGSNQDDFPGGKVTEKEVTSLSDLANHYLCAYNGGFLLLRHEEAQMLRDVIASHEPSEFLVKMHAFCEYLRDKKNSEDEEDTFTQNTESVEEEMVDMEM